MLALARDDNAIKLIRIKWPKLSVEHLHTFNGENSLLLSRLRDVYLVSIDEKLFASSDLSQWHLVLTLRPKNIIWHACETPEGIVVQDHGESPTGLLASSDNRNWTHILTNIDIDPKSKHFRYVSYDHHRDLLYVTLGDSNMGRAGAIRKDKRDSLYRGPWQFVPILILKDNLMFGMDSGIAKGGIGSYDFATGRWSFTFLKWQGKGVRFAQMCDLKLLTNNLYVAGLGQPQAIVVSRDARRWHLVHAEGFDEQYNMHVNISEGEKLVACSTGKNLLLVTKNELESLCETADPVMTDYKLGFIERLIGLGFNIKHRLIV